jgi:hypothetical protein
MLFVQCFQGRTGGCIRGARLGGRASQYPRADCRARQFPYQLCRRGKFIELIALANWIPAISTNLWLL